MSKPQSSGINKKVEKLGIGGSGRSAGNKATRMPELTGSEKQIKWAKQIRSELYSYLDQIEKGIKNGDKKVWIGENNEPLYIRTDERGADGKKIQVRLTSSDIKEARKEIDKLFRTSDGKNAGFIIDHRNVLNGYEIMNRIRNRKKTKSPIFKKTYYSPI